jgi:2-methylcitrate dehydratase PrpD
LEQESIKVRRYDFQMIGVKVIQELMHRINLTYDSEFESNRNDFSTGISLKSSPEYEFKLKNSVIT